MSDTDTERSDRPDYGIELVDELPPKPKRKHSGGGRSSVYDPLLPQVAAYGAELEEDDEGNVTGGGRWVRLATFHTPYGAQTAANSLTKQERKVAIPGDVEAWEFAGRRDTEEGSSDSYLFARYNAEAIEYVPPTEDADVDEDADADKAEEDSDAEVDEDGDVEGSEDEEDIFEVDD